MTDSLQKTIANIITVNLLSYSVKLDIPVSELISKQATLELAKLFEDSKISNQGLSKAIDLLIKSPSKSVEEILTANDLLQMTDTKSLEVFVDLVLGANSEQEEQYRAGKVQVLGYLVGQCMKESKGQGNPKIFGDLLIQKLSKS